MHAESPLLQSFSTACSASDQSPLCATPSWQRAGRSIGCTRNTKLTFSRLISRRVWMVIAEKPIAIAWLLISPSRLRRQSAASLQTMLLILLAGSKSCRCPICRSSASDETVACTASLHGLLPRRPFDAHKNQFGRVGIVAGSRGFAGAASMCAWGALRGGAGLVEVFVPENIYEIVATAAPSNRWSNR